MHSGLAGEISGKITLMTPGENVDLMLLCLFVYTSKSAVVLFLVLFVLMLILSYFVGDTDGKRYSGSGAIDIKTGTSTNRNSGAINISSGNG